MPGVKAQSPPLPLVSPNYLGFHHPHPTVTGDSDGSRGGAGPPPIKHGRGVGLEESRQTPLIGVSLPEPGGVKQLFVLCEPLASSPGQELNTHPSCGQIQEPLWQEVWGKPTVVNSLRISTHSQQQV